MQISWSALPVGCARRLAASAAIASALLTLPAAGRSRTLASSGLYTVGPQLGGIRHLRGMVGRVGLHVIDADLTDPEVRVAAIVAASGIGSAEPFQAMVRRARPAAAITGTFFGLANRIPTGDLVINGHAVFRGFIGTALAVTDENVAAFVPTRYRDQRVDWSPFETVVRAGPRLVADGRVVLDARGEGFRTLPVSVPRTRTAVALTAKKHLLLIATREAITLWQLAKAVDSLGVTQAVALDGGTSTALYYGGSMVIRPSRSLTNALLLYPTRARYEAARPALAPGVRVRR